MRRFILYIGSENRTLQGIWFPSPKQGRYCLNWIQGFLFQEGLPYFETEEEMFQAIREYEPSAGEIHIEWLDKAGKL